MSQRKVFVLAGEGIECEKESLRFFSTPELNLAPELLWVQKLLREPEKTLGQMRAGDWVFFPGGFSFADHFGSGKLLSYQLNEQGIYKKFLARGLNLLGVCNGFQVLTEAGLFGDGVALLANEVRGERIHFTNRWVDLETAGPVATAKWHLPVRHGEGRLQRKAPQWAKNVQPFLVYRDEKFHNGSVEDVAGLWATYGQSKVIGLMPHPEIALRPLDNPDTIGPEIAGLQKGAQNSKVRQSVGDGLRLVQEIFKEG